MSVYYFTIIFTFIFSYLAVAKSKPEIEQSAFIRRLPDTKFFLFLTAAVLIFVAGMRYFVGTDFGAYYRALTTYAVELDKRIRELDEPGLAVLAAIIKLFTNDGAVFIFVMAALTIGSILYITYKYTDTYLFATLLFVFVGIWHGTFNGVRQYFAAAIICLGHRLILDKKPWKYMLCVFMAYLFHSSAIVMVIPYFILRNKVSFKNLLFLTIGSIVLLYNYEFIFSFVSELKSETVDSGLRYMSSSVNTLRLLVCAAPAVFCLFLHYKVELNAEQTFYLNILILYALLSIVGMNSPYLSRVNIYLSVLLPVSMGRLITFKDKKTEIIIKCVIIILFFYFWNYEISKSDALNNWHWVWER